MPRSSSTRPLSSFAGGGEGILILASLLVTRVGNTVHVLQVVGWAPITPIENLVLLYWTGVRLGLYATWEGIIAQFKAVIFVFGSHFAAEWSHDRWQRAKLEASMAAQSGITQTQRAS